MWPAEDALLVLRLAERHLGNLRGTLDLATLEDEDWGFLVQQTLEKRLKALLMLCSIERPGSDVMARVTARVIPLLEPNNPATLEHRHAAESPPQGCLLSRSQLAAR